MKLFRRENLEKKLKNRKRNLFNKLLWNKDLNEKVKKLDKIMFKKKQRKKRFRNLNLNFKKETRLLA